MVPLLYENPADYDFEQAAWDVEQAVLAAGCLKYDEFTFASGEKASRKIVIEMLEENPHQLGIVMENMARFPGLRDADVLLAVPDGAQTVLGERLTGRLGIPLARTRKLEGRYEFAFVSDDDRDLATNAIRPWIIEDAVTTLGSVAGVARLLDPARQDIHALAVWNRGRPKPQYQAGLTDHYLVERFIPLN